jgi:hypothetical protein
MRAVGASGVPIQNVLLRSEFQLRWFAQLDGCGDSGVVIIGGVFRRCKICATVCLVTLVIDMKQGININNRIATSLDKRIGRLLGST